MYSLRRYLCFMVTKWAKYLSTDLIKVYASSKNQSLIPQLFFRTSKFSSALHVDVGWFWISFTMLGIVLRRAWTPWPFFVSSNSGYSMNKFTFFAWELVLWTEHTTLHIVYLLEILLAPFFMQKSTLSDNIWEQFENSMGYRIKNI